MAYIAEDISRVVLSKGVCRQLGIIDKEFPKIGVVEIDDNKRDEVINGE